MRASSTAGIESLKNYSMKEDTRVAGPYHDGSRYTGEDLITRLYPWQDEIKSACAERPDDRTINVVVNPSGNIGKSAFCKYMAWHHKTLVMGWGRTGDLLNLVSKNPNKTAYFFDLARSKPQDWGKDDIASAMEGIKNGLFMNTKYETCQVIMRSPHIWIFTNVVPNLSSMSMDRWRLWEVDGERRLVRLSNGRVSVLRRIATGSDVQNRRVGNQDDNPRASVRARPSGTDDEESFPYPLD